MHRSGRSSLPCVTASTMVCDHSSGILLTPCAVSEDEGVNVALPSVDRQAAAPKTWRVPAEAVAALPDDGTAQISQRSLSQCGDPGKRKPRTVSSSKRPAAVKTEPATASPGPQSAARSTRSRKRAR